MIIYNGEIISIEFKLKDWKKAIKQAFRYRSFSSESYVFLDQEYINNAIKNIELFELYNVGLCGVSMEGINSCYKPNKKKAFSEEMAYKAYNLFCLDHDYVK